MNAPAMTFQHQSAPWEWPLARARATRLAAANTPRWLLVTAGQVWLTQTGAGLAGGDIWLKAGERHALPAGSEWVVEAWPEGRVALLEAPGPPAGRRTLGRGWAPVLRAA
jgi:hypothetical protein